MKSWCYRYGYFLFGVILNSFGIALITKADMGTSPISSLPYVLSFRFPITLGGFTFIMNTFFVLGQILLLQSVSMDSAAANGGQCGVQQLY